MPLMDILTIKHSKSVTIDIYEAGSSCTKDLLDEKHRENLQSKLQKVWFWQRHFEKSSNKKCLQSKNNLAWPYQTWNRLYNMVDFLIGLVSFGQFCENFFQGGDSFWNWLSILKSD